MRWPTRPGRRLQNHRAGLQRGGASWHRTGPANGTAYVKPYLIRRWTVWTWASWACRLRPRSPILRAPGHHPVPGRNHGRAKSIDELKAKGIRHIVLLSHLGYDADKVIAPSSAMWT